MDDLTYYMSEAYGDFRRKFMNSKAFVDDFARRVGSPLPLSSVGNSYSVSRRLWNWTACSRTTGTT